MVKVRIREGYEGHYHAGTLCEPGDVIEVAPRQAAWLHSLGATEPFTEPEMASEPDEETPEEEDTTEGAEETPEDT